MLKHIYNLDHVCRRHSKILDIILSVITLMLDLGVLIGLWLYLVAYR